MILGGLVSLGVDAERLETILQRLNVPDFEIKFAKVDRAGISAFHSETVYRKEEVHRHFSDIKRIIGDSDLSETVKTRSIEIFRNLAKAEAKVHGIEHEKVHFHEVGAMDAILDVVGACIGFEILGIEQFVCSKIHVGSGFIEMEHGKYPVPPPAVSEILKRVPIYSTEIEGELTTPTGAAILSTVCNDFGAILEMKIEKTGYGAGTREYEKFPNALRLIVGEAIPQRRKDAKDVQEMVPQRREGAKRDEIKDQSPKSQDQTLLLLETNLDDISSEVLGYVMEKAFDVGALDCWFTPIQMKKNRPATTVSILCENEKRDELMELLFFETTTLGVRISEIERTCLERETRKVKTEYGDVNVKVGYYKKNVVNVKPEYEKLREIAVETGRSLSEIEELVLEEFKYSSRKNKVVGK